MTARFNLISSSCRGLLAVGRYEVGGTSTVVLTLKRICAVTMCVCVCVCVCVCRVNPAVAKRKSSICHTVALQTDTGRIVIAASNKSGRRHVRSLAGSSRALVPFSRSLADPPPRSVAEAPRGPDVD
jgi:hypothetical protein